MLNGWLQTVGDWFDVINGLRAALEVQQLGDGFTGSNAPTSSSSSSNVAPMSNSLRNVAMFEAVYVVLGLFLLFWEYRGAYISLRKKGQRKWKNMGFCCEKPRGFIRYVALSNQSMLRFATIFLSFIAAVLLSIDSFLGVDNSLPFDVSLLGVFVASTSLFLSKDLTVRPSTKQRLSSLIPDKLKLPSDMTDVCFTFLSLLKKPVTSKHLSGNLLKVVDDLSPIEHLAFMTWMSVRKFKSLKALSNFLAEVVISKGLKLFYARDIRGLNDAPASAATVADSFEVALSVDEVSTVENMQAKLNALVFPKIKAIVQALNGVLKNVGGSRVSSRVPHFDADDDGDDSEILLQLPELRSFDPIEMNKLLRKLREIKSVLDDEFKNANVDMINALEFSVSVTIELLKINAISLSDHPGEGVSSVAFWFLRVKEICAKFDVDLYLGEVPAIKKLFNEFSKLTANFKEGKTESLLDMSWFFADFRQFLKSYYRSIEAKMSKLIELKGLGADFNDLNLREVTNTLRKDIAGAAALLPNSDESSSLEQASNVVKYYRQVKSILLNQLTELVIKTAPLIVNIAVIGKSIRALINTKITLDVDTLNAVKENISRIRKQVTVCIQAYRQLADDVESSGIDNDLSLFLDQFEEGVGIYMSTLNEWLTSKNGETLQSAYEVCKIFDRFDPVELLDQVIEAPHNLSRFIADIEGARNMRRV